MSQCSETKNQHEVVVPRTDFFRSEGAYAMHIEVPGVSAEEISLDTTERTLSLTASAAVLERRFQRTYRIPRDAFMEEVEAKLEHGILRVLVPRRSRDAGRRIEVASA